MHESEKNARVGIERTPKRRKREPLDRLTRDAIAAQEAGMSYGKWKALHPHTPDEDDEEVKIEPSAVIANCEYCGEKFVKTKSSKLFCSETCQRKHNAKKRLEKERQAAIGRTAVCDICGADFVATAHNRKYCSPGCYAEGQRRRARERWEHHQKELKKEREKNGTN